MTSMHRAVEAFRERARRALGGGAGSLRARVIQGGSVLMIADLYSSVLRLGANLVMTRLLYPEAFGLMLILNLVFSALEMLSDLGIRSALIVKKGEIDSRYLNTAWTLSVLRGLLLAVVAFGLAYPVASYYGHDELFPMIALASLAPLINGFCSPHPMLSEKNVQFGRIVIWKSSVQTLAMLILLAWLLIHPTIWALVANGIVAAILNVLISYRMFPAERPALRLDRSAALEIVNIGKWVVLASALTFLARQGDSVIISKWVTADLLGIFSIALGFAKLVETLVERISWSLLFPVYAEIQAAQGTRFNQQLGKVKLVLYALCGPMVLFFAVFGSDFIRLLYDPRYHEAGWMLQIMAAGSAFFAAGSAIINIPMSFGDSYRHMLLQFGRFVLLLSAMLVGGWYSGLPGLVAGIAVSQGLFYPVLIAMARRYGVRNFAPDMAFLAVTLGCIALSWSLRGMPI